MSPQKSRKEREEPRVIRQFHWPAATTTPNTAQSRDAKQRNASARRNWTKDEDAVIRRHYPKSGSRRTAELLGRTVTSVQHRALKLGVPGHGIRAWTAKEEHYLRKYYGKLTAAEIARILKRSVQSVRGHIHQLGLGNYRPSAWTDAEVEYLQRHYGRERVSELATELGRTTDAVELKAGKLGLRKKLVKLTPRQIEWVVEHLGRVSYDNMARKLGVSSTTIMKIAARHGYRPRPHIRPWTQQEDEFLKKNYGTMTRRAIAESINRTVPLVGWRAAKLGLTRESRQIDKVRPWSHEDDMTLRKLLPDFTHDQIAERLNRTRAAVVGRAVRLGLSRSDRERTGHGRKQ